MSQYNKTMYNSIMYHNLNYYFVMHFKFIFYSVISVSINETYVNIVLKLKFKVRIKKKKLCYVGKIGINSLCLLNYFNSKSVTRIYAIDKIT